jgi:hypothetical protein
MKYTLTTYRDGKVVANREDDGEEAQWFLLVVGANRISNGTADEYEITNERGHVVAYAYTEDSPKAKEKEADYNADRREVRADMARDIQRDELASRAHCGAGKS